MKDKPACRLTLVFASQAKIAVILRRGPSKWVNVVKWNTATDSFEDGQWFHGRIYEERCGLSPDGKLMVYFAAKYRGGKTEDGYDDTFTAVSKPPYLTALAMWPHGDTWGGGGRFIDNNTLRLAYSSNGTRTPHGGRTEIFMAPIPEHHPKHSPGLLKIETDLDHYDTDRSFRASTPMEKTDWIGKDHQERTIFIRHGALYAIDKLGRDVLLRDFNPDERHSVIAPPWARSWS